MLKTGTKKQSLLVSVFAAPVEISEDVGDACVGAHEGCGAVVEQGPDTEDVPQPWSIPMLPVVLKAELEVLPRIILHRRAHGGLHRLPISELQTTDMKCSPCK